jgi:hypothetical protein
VSACDARRADVAGSRLPEKSHPVALPAPDSTRDATSHFQLVLSGPIFGSVLVRARRSSRVSEDERGVHGQPRSVKRGRALRTTSARARYASDARAVRTRGPTDRRKGTSGRLRALNAALSAV